MAKRTGKIILQQPQFVKEKAQFIKNVTF